MPRDWSILSGIDQSRASINKNKRKNFVKKFVAKLFQAVKILKFVSKKNAKMDNVKVEGSRQRSTNFSIDEDRVLREGFSKHREALTSAFSNKVTNKTKKNAWNEIAASVSAVGYSVRDAASCKTRWKNLTTTAKRVFNEHKLLQRGTGGGPPPKPPSSSISKTIDLLKGSTKFKGIDGGISTFTTIPTPPNVSLSDDSFFNDEEAPLLPPTATTTKPKPSPLEMLSQMVAEENREASCSKTANVRTVEEALSSTTNNNNNNPPTKRKHYETVADVQLRVLKKEEAMQKMKEENLKIERRTLLINEQVSLLKKRKLEIELTALQPETQHEDDSQESNQEVPLSNININSDVLLQLVNSAIENYHPEEQLQQK